jgi:hypothetical protein
MNKKNLNTSHMPSAAMLLSGLEISPSTLADAPDYTTEWTGTWINKDPNTKGITRFVLAPIAKHRFKLQVFGKCHPTDCSWGSAEMVTYQGIDGYYFYGTAAYNLKFKKTILFLTLAEGPIVLQTLNQFKDKSDRPNFYTSEQFQRISPQ